MKNRTILFTFITILFCVGCTKFKDCGECFTPPDMFVFELLDHSTGENLFTNGTFNADDLEILDSSNDEVNFTFISENNVNLIQVHTIGWQTEIVNYRINISSVNIFDLYVDAERLSSDCCSYTYFNEVEIGNAEFSRDSETGIYKILVD